MPLKLVTAATAAPITLAEAKEHLRVTRNDEDLLITRLISAATSHCEKVTNFTFMRQTWEKILDVFPYGAIELPKPPVNDVEQISFVDVNGNTQLLDPQNYVVDAESYPGWVTPRYGYVWPPTYPEINSVRIRFTCGFATPDAVPDDIKHALLLLVAHWFENREASSSQPNNSILFAVESLLAPYKMVTL